MTDPYKLPDGPVAIQFSGGRTSGYMLKHVLDRYDGALPDDCHVLFQNTGREMPETLDFVHECQTQWNVPIVWLERGDNDDGFEVVSHNSASRNGEPFKSLIDKRSYAPNRVARFCTSDLKVRPSKKWMMAQGYDHWFAIIGFRADEERRTKGKTADRERWDCYYPLFHAGVARRDVEDWWSKQSFDLTLPTFNGKTALGNCDGCFLKSEKNRAWLARYMPNRAQWWANIEAGGKFFTPPEENKTWQKLIDHASAQADWVFDEENDTYCDTGFGGCHD
jgi:3'-phosphoadenosine 5'-phosphosulfate sulfotransferase (PAPS reductase)/FAD synthetase